MASTPVAADAHGKQKSAMTETIIPLAIATLLAAGGGAFLGMKLVGDAPPPKAVAEAAAAAGHGGSEHGEAAPAESGHGESAHGESGHGDEHGGAPKPAPAPVLVLKSLTPIVTNLSGSQKSWIRMQCAVLYDSAATPHPDEMFAKITADTLAYLRTQTMASLEGAEGLRRVQEDLSERVAIRSEGHVHELIIETMVVQ